MPKHVLVIFNPTARSQAQTELWFSQIIEKLNAKDEYIVSFYPTTAHTGPENLVPLFKPPLDLVIAAGGDGTVRFALAALAKAQSSIPCAILPLGTGNLLARNLGVVETSIFANPLEHAFDYIVNGQAMPMDLIMMNGDYFAGIGGVGPLSDAFMTPDRKSKTKFKLAAYIAELLMTITKPPRIFKITTGGVSFCVQASGVFVSNIEDMGIAKAGELESLRDGQFALHIVNPLYFKDYVSLGFRFAVGREDESVPEYVMHVKEVVIETMPKKGVRSAFQSAVSRMGAFLTRKKTAPVSTRGQLPIMIDGEQCGLTPMRCTILPRAVNVLVAHDAFASGVSPPEQSQSSAA
jgi:diacylglycerol kinase family enzyme